jgi:hypothetical protein
MRNNKKTYTKIAMTSLLLMSATDVYACPVTTRAANFPSSFATSSTSTITFTLSNKGAFNVTRTLLADLPSNAASCTSTLLGRFSRNLSYSSLRTLGTSSSLSKRLRFRATKLPAVRADRFKGQTVQPSLHLQVVTECSDNNGATVFSDTSPVVARYADCGFTKARVGMGSFVSQLIRKLGRAS